MHGDKGGLNELFFHLLVEHFVQSVAPGGVLSLCQLDAHALSHGHGFGVVSHRVKVQANILLDGLCHGQTRPAGRQADVLAHPVQFVRAQQVASGAGEQVFKQVHHVVEVGIGFVQFDGGKFGVVLGVHALVAEDTSHFVHPFQAAHDEPLQVQLGGDAHVHVQIQGVVMGDEGTSGSAAGDGVQDGGLHFHVAPVVQEVTEVLDELRAQLEGLAHVGVDDQVHVALTIAGLPVGQAVELFGQGTQALGQQLHFAGADGDLTLLGFEHLALDAHDVADVALLEPAVFVLTHQVLADVQLHPAGLILEVAEADLAHAALGHETACHGHFLAFQLVEPIGHVGSLVGGGVLGDGEGVAAGLLEGGQLVPTDL